MDFDQALAYLLSQADLERDPARRRADPGIFQVDRMGALLDRLGRPDAGRLTVHVAGSKGKGSTASMIAGMLQSAGYRTGLYTSPHLHSFRERIAVDGEPIGEAEFGRVVGEIEPFAEALGPATGRVTTFEHLTALAFRYFEQAGCDAQVIEVGLGGRLDATNALLAKDVCAVTPISLEHTEILGTEVEQIASEKAGIFRAGADAVIALQRHAGALAVLRARAEDLGMPVTDVERDYRWTRGRVSEASQQATVEGPAATYELTIPLLGLHQLENAATAVAAIDRLRLRGATVDPRAVEEGMARVRWPGRLEVVHHRPLVVLDGAHNGDSAARLRESLEQYFSFERLLLVVGVGRDKDVEAIADELAPLAARVICTRSSHPRAADPAEVAPAFATRGVPVRVSESVREALAAALEDAGPADLVCVMGSLFAVADARELLVTAPLTAGYAG
jgi:dihydrofolate synthase/folylpolyglutamate synthase